MSHCNVIYLEGILMSIANLITSIQAFEFEEAGKKEAGYSQESVDGFVHSLVKTLENERKEVSDRLLALGEENAALALALEEAQSAAVPAATVEADTEIRDSVSMLELADRVAREHIEEAKEEADNIVTSANTEANNLIAARKHEYQELDGKISALQNTFARLRSDVLSSVSPLLGDATPTGVQATEVNKND